MNHLNSIILEGKVTTITRPPFDGLRKVVRFTIESHREWSNGSDVITEFHNFDVEAEDALAESCSRNMEEGRIVRIVGRLRGESCVVVIAEHVEYKPIKAKAAPCA